MKTAILALSLASTLASAECTKEQSDVIAKITEAVKTQSASICMDDTYFYKDAITFPIIIAVRKDLQTWICKLGAEWIECFPMDAEEIKKKYNEIVEKKSV